MYGVPRSRVSRSHQHTIGLGGTACLRYPRCWVSHALHPTLRPLPSLPLDRSLFPSLASYPSHHASFQTRLKPILHRPTSRARAAPKAAIPCHNRHARLLASRVLVRDRILYMGSFNPPSYVPLSSLHPRLPALYASFPSFTLAFCHRASSRL